MSKLVFDETLLEGSTEERVAKAKALLEAGCLLLKRSLTQVLLTAINAPASPRGTTVRHTNASFIQWAYAHIGVHVSHLAAAQRNGMRELAWGEARMTDLICFIRSDLPNNVLNGIVSDQQTVIYHCPRKKCVIEVPFEALASVNLRGIKRMLPTEAQRKTVVICLPNRKGLEPTKETVRRLIQAHLPPTEASAA